MKLIALNRPDGSLVYVETSHISHFQKALVTDISGAQTDICVDGNMRVPVIQSVDAIYRMLTDEKS
jgi:hypothetical protein